MDSSLAPRLVDLHDPDIRRLDPLLTEETAEWRARLDWDFGPAAALIRRQGEERRLSGAALIDGAEIAGCGYVAVESNRGLIVDAYVRTPWRNQTNQSRLFRALFGALVATREIDRVEAQLLLLAPPKSPLPGVSVRSFDRLLMRRVSTSPLPLARKAPSPQFRIEPWSDAHLDAAASLLSRTRAGHVDAELSDHYRTPSRAAGLVRSIVGLGTGGTFCNPASFLAFDHRTARLAGLSLACFVGEGAGHISEISVAPEAQGRGLGYELLRMSIDALEVRGAGRVSLAVTAANESAITFYRKCGFREYHRFAAYAWDREPALTSPTSESRNTAALFRSPDS